MPVHPCHIIPDTDLYGFGMRLAFYISFAAGVFGVLFGCVEEMRGPRLSFNALLLSLLVVLIRNTLRGSFALFEWYIVMGLAFLSLPALVPIPGQEHLDDEQEEHSEQCNELQGENTEQGEKEKTLEEQVNELREEIVKGWAKESKRAFLSDAIGLGFLNLILGLFSSLLPWLHFTRASSGHKDGCPVPIVLFGTIDLYDAPWQYFLKISAILGVLLAAILVFWGVALIFDGLFFWKVREMALELLNKEQSSTSKILKLLDNKTEESQQNEPHHQGIMENGDATDSRIQLADAIEHARGRSLAAQADRLQAEEIIQRTIEKADDYRKRRSAIHKFRGVLFASYTTSGGLTIWFMEKTLRLNDIDLKDEIGSSSGQILALSMSILTTAGFIYESLKGLNKISERRAKRKQVEQWVIAEAIKRRVVAMHWEVQWEMQRDRLWGEFLNTFTGHSQPTQDSTEQSSEGLIRPGRTGRYWTMPRFGRQRTDRQSESVV
ncbi:Fc.00g024080.m01.CDS01 [Cosmosporella sp. VM-42]